MHTAAWTSLLLLACAACGSSGSGPANSAAQQQAADDDNTVFVIPPISHTGDANTVPATGPTVGNFTFGDVVSFQYAQQNGIAGITARIVINSTPSACNDANANALHVGETQLVIDLTDLPDSQMASNTYVFPAGANAPYELAAATFAAVQAPCYYNAVNVLVAGTVQLTSVQQNNSLSGNYTLQFAAGTVSGTFSAPNCGAVGVTQATAPTCN